MFLKLVDGIVTYPYDTYSDYPTTSFPIGEDYPEFNIYWVNEITPTFDPLTHKPVEAQPIFDKTLNAWLQTWDIVELSAEEKRNLVPIVPMHKAKKALLRAGKLDALNQAIAAVGGEPAIDWEYATEIPRNSPLVDAFTAQLGWSEDEVNQLFQLANSL